MSTPRILTICLNPVLQKTLTLEALTQGEVNRLSTHRFDASGKGVNVTRVLSQLGEQAVHLTQLGGRFREQFIALVAGDGLRMEWCDSDSEIRFCYTLLEQRFGSTTEIVEEADPVGPQCESQLSKLYDELLPNSTWVVISGSRAPGFSQSLFSRWVATARGAGKGVTLDIRGADLLSCLDVSPDVVKPNYEEFVATFFERDSNPTLEEVHTMMEGIAARHNLAVVVTRGKHDTLVATRTKRWVQPVQAVPPLNTTGSGDALTAGLTAALARGATLREAVAEGHRCGALNAQLVRPGTIR